MFIFVFALLVSLVDAGLVANYPLNDNRWIVLGKKFLERREDLVNEERRPSDLLKVLLQDDISKFLKLNSFTPKITTDDENQNNLLFNLENQRNKRFALNGGHSKQRKHYNIKDPSLCHFKICNMGRIRTTRFSNMIRT